MKQKLQLQIPEPCHENWDAMTPNQQGRFCISCQKQVVDFSVMSDKEILSYISTASSNMCGRAQDDQLNRLIQVQADKKQYSFKYLWSLMLTSFLISNKSSGQSDPIKHKIVAMPAAPGEKKPMVLGGFISIVAYDEPNWQISGRVVDENGAPVPYASVSINGLSTGIATNADGLFSLTTKQNSSPAELIVSSVGFIEQKIDLKRKDFLKSSTSKNAVMKMDAGDIVLKTKTMDEVVVTGYGITKGKVMISGAMLVVKTDTIFGAIKNIVKEVIGKNDFKVYPNPVSLNSSFNIKFNIKEPGDYHVQFTDALGRIVYSKMVNIVSDNQMENFSSYGLQQSGAYFISVKGKTKIYSSRMLVQ